MMSETPTISTMTCACGGPMKVSLVEDCRLPLCGPSVTLCLACADCGNLSSPFPLPSMAQR